MLDNLAQQVLSFLVFLVLARFIAPQEFGLIAIANVIVTLVRQTVFDAISHPVARAKSTSDTLYSWAFSVFTSAALLMAVLMLAGAMVWPWPQLLANRHVNGSFLKLTSALKSPIIATGTMLIFLLIVAYVKLIMVAFLGVVVGGGRRLSADPLVRF